MIIKKSQKLSYKFIKRWYLITLFLIFNKVIKIIKAYKLATAAETTKVLSETQIRNCTNYSTKHVLDLITSQV